MKRYTFLILLFLLLCCNTYSNDIVYIVIHDSNLRTTDNLFGSVATVQKDDIVYFQGQIFSNLDDFEILVRTEYGKIGFIKADHVLLKDNQQLPNSIVAKVWIPSYYQYVLRGEQKETLFNFEPFWRDEYNEHTKGWNIVPEPWWRYAGLTKFKFMNNLIFINGLYTADFIQFATISQRQNGTSIIFDILCEDKSNYTPQNHFLIRFVIGEINKITIITDGDYLNIFINNEAVAIYSLVGVDEYFANSVWNVLNNRSIDPSRIIWPRRADGTMDYPPPIDMSSYRPTHRVTENLRLRDSANTSSLIVTTLQKDTEVQVIETGANATINNITAPWVKVISSTGFTGWCFSGYLEEIVGNNAIVTNADTAENSLVSNEDANSLPFWVWILVGMGVVVGVALAVIVRKRR